MNIQYMKILPSNYYICLSKRKYGKLNIPVIIFRAWKLIGFVDMACLAGLLFGMLIGLLVI